MEKERYLTFSINLTEREKEKLIALLKTDKDLQIQLLAQYPTVTPVNSPGRKAHNL